MSAIVPFEASALPAHLRNIAPLTSDLTANVGGGGGFPVMSIKGKTFTLVRDGARETLMNPDDPDEVAASISVVLLKANAGLSKVWYATGYIEGSDSKPDCFSHDGTAPDPTVEKPQSSKCATCPKNAWGSKISEAGKKLKACADSRRVAVANVDAIDDPILLRVPAATLAPLAEYGAKLAEKGAPYNAVITKIGFDREAASPKLTFKATGWLTADQFAQVTAVLETPVVHNILGAVGSPAIGADAEVGDLPEKGSPVETPAAKAKPAAPAAKAKPAAPAAKAEPQKAAPAVKIVGADSLESELDALLGTIED